MSIVCLWTFADEFLCLCPSLALPQMCRTEAALGESSSAHQRLVQVAAGRREVVLQVVGRMVEAGREGRARCALISWRLQAWRQVGAGRAPGWHLGVHRRGPGVHMILPSPRDRAGSRSQGTEQCHGHRVLTAGILSNLLTLLFLHHRNFHPPVLVVL